MCLYPLYLNYLCLFFFTGQEDILSIWRKTIFFDTDHGLYITLSVIFQDDPIFLHHFQMGQNTLKLPDVHCCLFLLKKLFKLVKMTKQIKMVTEWAHIYKFWEKKPTDIQYILIMLQGRFRNYPTRPCHCCCLWLYYTF